MGNSANRLLLYRTPEHACGYLPEREASNLVTDPAILTPALYRQLLDKGFRRSGDYVYRPHCEGCTACLSLRVATNAFQPNRSQRRCLNNNRDLQLRQLPFAFYDEHYALFSAYLSHRHANGGMDDSSEEDYWAFIGSDWCETTLWELHLDDQLVAVAVVDEFADAYSSVYTFFDPQHSMRSLGTYIILRQIAEAKRAGLAWVYLGYWIEQSDKMVYKANFRPCQIFREGAWHALA